MGVPQDATASLGEFERLQRRIAELAEGDPSAIALREQSLALWKGHGARWLGESNGIQVVDYKFRRGLLDQLRLGVNGDDLPAWVANSPCLVYLTSLDISDHFTGGLQDAGAQALAASPVLSHLTRLNLGGNELGDDAAEALAGSTNVAYLSFLDLGANCLRDAGARALAASPHLSALETLRLDSNCIGDEGAAAIAGSPHFTRLVFLHLGQNCIGDKGAFALAASTHLARLERLVVGDNSISPAASEVLRGRYGDRVTLTY